MTTSSHSGPARWAWYAVSVAVTAIVALVYANTASEPETTQAGSVQVVGSETIRPIVTACAEEFMTTNPEADVIVKGGGSSDGVAALLHGIVDIGMISRELSDRERAYAASQGIEITMVGLGLDGITLVVHRDNPVTALSLEQIRDIFIGKIRNWRDLGGTTGDIQAFARAEGSGTALLFRERVLTGQPYGAAVRYLPTNEAIVGEVAVTPLAIGYSGLGALRTARDSVKVIALRADSRVVPVSPSEESVRSSHYPLARTLYLGVAGSPSVIVKSFLEFCTTGRGRVLVERAGYVAMISETP